MVKFGINIFQSRCSTVSAVMRTRYDCCDQFHNSHRERKGHKSVRISNILLKNANELEYIQYSTCSACQEKRARASLLKSNRYRESTGYLRSAAIVEEGRFIQWTLNSSRLPMISLRAREKFSFISCSHSHDVLELYQRRE